MSTHHHPTTLQIAVLAIAALCLTQTARAQQPTPAQQDALRQNCRADFQANCAGVQPGGPDALACLQKNASKLSPGCQQAVKAISPAPQKPAAAPAATPATTPAATPAAPAPAAKPTPAQQDAIRQSCRGDFQSNCAGVQPGGSDALACLQKNAAKLSPGCKQAVSAVSPSTPAAATAPAATTAAAPAAAPPTAEQLSAIKNTCKSDFKRNCSGVQPGGPEAIACLQQNASKLSPDCKTSLAAIADAGPLPAGATPATAPKAKVYPTPGIIPAVRIGRKIREKLAD